MGGENLLLASCTTFETTVLLFIKKSPQSEQGLKFLIQMRRNSENPGSRPMQFLISKLDLRLSMGSQETACLSEGLGFLKNIM